MAPKIAAAEDLKPLAVLGTLRKTDCGPLARPVARLTACGEGVGTPNLATGQPGGQRPIEFTGAGAGRTSRQNCRKSKIRFRCDGYKRN